MSESGTRYEEGDVVATDRGRGVVAAVLEDDFEFPQGDDELADVSASDDRPAYVVGLEGEGDGPVGAAVYRASSLRASSFEDEDAPRTADGGAETDAVAEDVNGLDDLPEGWDRESVLEYWSSIGGSWEECADDLADEFGDERAREHCSAMKDEVLRTERWRNRF